MARSFRGVLALRFGILAAFGMSLCVLITWFAFRYMLDNELNASMLNVASIQAAAVTDHAEGIMRFHEWELTPDEAESVVELIRYAQIWDRSGVSLLRSRYMVRDLPTDPEALESAAAGDLVWRTAEFGGYRIRSVFYPLVRLGDLHDEHVLQIAAPLQTRDTLLRRLAWFGAGLVLLTALGAMLGGRWLASRAIRPVTAIIQQAEGVDAANLTHRISAFADTAEYERLVVVLNTMLDRIHASFEAQRRFTADASHELRTPLTSMRGEIELALRRIRDPEHYRETLGSALEEVLRMGGIVEGLLTLARADAGAIELQRASLDLADLATQATERLAGDAAGPSPHQPHRVHAKVLAPKPVVGEFDGRLVLQAVGNLIANAAQHAGPTGRVQVSVYQETDYGVVCVEDSGPGLSPTDAERAFQRFWQADPSRSQDGPASGVGLGLSIVEAIVRVHGGSVAVERSLALGGAAFQIKLPLTLRA